MSYSETIARASIVMLLFALLSRATGLGREMAIAYSLGATAAADAFLVAFVIPYAFYTVIGLALAAAVVPIFAEYNAQGLKHEAFQVMNLVANAVVAAMLVVALIGIIGAPLIASVLGVGFASGTLDLTAKLTAIMMPAIIFFSLAGVLSGVLNANNVFGRASLGPAVMNVAIICAALFAGTGFGVYGLAIGSLIGSLAFVLVQLPALRNVGFKYSFNLRFWHPDVKRVVLLMLPVTITTSISQVYIMIDWRLASTLTEGSIAALNYASKLIHLPQALFVVAISTAIYPTISHLAAEENYSALVNILQRGMKTILLLAVPVAVGLIVLREPIVTLLFERGAFDSRASEMTTSALLFYAIGLVAFCLNLPLARGFFSMQDTRTPLLVAGLAIGFKLILSLIFVRLFNHSGLALATSLAALFNMSVLAWLLRRRLSNLFGADMFRFSIKIILASAVMGLTIYMADLLLARYMVVSVAIGAAGSDSITSNTSMLAIRIAVDIIVGVSIFFLASFILKLDELRYLLNRAKLMFARSSY